MVGSVDLMMGDKSFVSVTSAPIVTLAEKENDNNNNTKAAIIKG